MGLIHMKGTHPMYCLMDGLLSLAVLKFEKFCIQIELNNIHSWPNYQILDSFFHLLNSSTYMPYHFIISSNYIIQTHFQSQPTTLALVRPSICIHPPWLKVQCQWNILVFQDIFQILSPAYYLLKFYHSPVLICLHFSDDNPGLSLVIAFNLYFQTHRMVSVPCLEFDFPRSICHFILFVCFFLIF